MIIIKTISNIILGIICGFFNISPLSTINHLYIYNKLFNTSIFENQALINTISSIGTLIALIIYIIPKKKIKIRKKLLLKKIIKDLSISLVLSIPLILIPLSNNISLSKIKISLIISSILLLFIKNKQYTNSNLNFKNIIFSLIIESILTVLNVPIILTLMFSLLIQKKNINSIFHYALFSYLITITINLFINISILELTYHSLFIIITSCIISLITLKWLHNKIINNNLIPLSIYNIILFIFITVWFR